MTMALTSRPISGRSSIGGRAFSVMCAVRTPVSDEETNGFCPASISYSITPIE